MKSFDKYYTMLGLPVLGDEEVRAKLKLAIENSRKKDYHGNSEEVNKVPPVNEQSAKFLEESHDIFEFYDEGKNSWIEAKSPKWKEAVLKRYEWINNTLQNFEEKDQPTPAFFASASDSKKVYGEFLDYKKNDPLFKRHEVIRKGEKVLTFNSFTKFEDYSAEFNWMQLYQKLAFEDMLDNFSELCDFKVMYKYINASGPHLSTIVVPILDKTKFKSNNYWIMALVGRLSAVTTFKFKKDSNIGFGADGFKFL